MSNFSSALKKAAGESLAAGSINPATHAAVVAAADDPHIVAAAEPVAAWHVGEALGSIDWAKLIQQIQVLIPFIMQLIQLFTKPQPTPPAPPSAPPTSPQGSAP